MRLRNRKLNSPALPGKQTTEVEREEETSNPPLEDQVPVEENDDSDPSDSADRARGEPRMADQAPDDAAPPPVNRSVGVMMGNRVFPAPDRYDGEDWWSDDGLVASAPWFDIDAINHGDIVRRYVRPNGDLPGKLPLSAVNTWCWRNQFVPRNDDLVTDGSSVSALEAARAAFIRRSFRGCERISTLEPVDPAHSGMFLYRTFGEMDYLEALNGITPELIASWRGQELCHDDAWVWTKPQLKAEFRYTRKVGPHWTVNVKNERRLRSRYGRPVPYQCLSTFGVRRSFMERAFCELTGYWSRIEVPRGCSAELPMVFSYKMRELMDPQSGWWVVAYTEFAVKVAAFILMDAYDRFRLWALSPTLISQLLMLDLDGALGNAENARELRRMLRVINDTDFSSLPNWWSARGDAESRSPGRTGIGADWVYYDPWQRCKLPTAEEAEYRRRNAPTQIPFGHPRGWDFTSATPGWTAEQVLQEGWDDVSSPEGGAREGRENEDADAPVSELRQAAEPPATPLHVNAQGAGPSTAVAAGGSSAAVPSVVAANAGVTGGGDRLSAVLNLLPDVPEFIRNGSPEVVAAFLYARMQSSGGSGGGGNAS